MSRKISLLDIHISVLLFGMAGLFGKWLDLSPLIIVLGRVVFACLSLSVIIALRRIGFSVFPARRRIELFFLGILLAAHWCFFFQSIRVSTVAIGLLSYSTFPLFTAFLEPLFSRTRVKLKNLGFALVCMTGVFLIIPRIEWSNQIFQGVVWGILSGVSFALLSIFNRILTQSLPNIQIAFYEMSSAALILFPSVLFIKPQISGSDFLLLIVLGLFCTALAHSLFIRGLRAIKAHQAAVIASLEPVYGIIFAVILLGEIPSMKIISGGLMILLAVTAVTMSANSRRQEKQISKKSVKKYKDP